MDDARKHADELALLRAARAGDPRAEDMLVRAYRPLAVALSRQFFHTSNQDADFEQEALWGVVLAIRCYEPTAGTFAAFVRLCVHRNLVTALKMTQRDKHRPLNEAHRHGTDDEGETIDLIDAAPARDPLTHDRVAVMIDLEEMALRIRRDLTYIEAAALLAISNGVVYDDVERMLGLEGKAVDNAVQRARRKLSNEQNPATVLPVHRCPRCAGATVRTRDRRLEAKHRPGRPPLCNVCRFRAAVARADRAAALPSAA